MQQNMRLRLPQLGLMILVGLGLGWLSLRNVDLDEVSSTLAQGNLGYFVLALGMMGLFYLFRAKRWSVILRGQAPTLSLFGYINIGYLASTILPLQAGELIKPGFLRSLHGVGYAEGLASVGLERLLDILALVVIGGVSALIVSMTYDIGGTIATVLYGASIVAAILLILLAAVLFKTEAVGRYFGPVFRILPLPKAIREKVPAIADSLIQGIGIVRSPRQLAIAIALSILIWLANFCGVWFVFLCLDVYLPLSSMMLGFAVVSLGLSVPLSPGYIGQYELLWVTVFAALKTGSSDTIVSLGLLSHIVILGTIVILGLGSLIILRKPLSCVIWGSSRKERVSSPPGAVVAS